ncbi:P-loop containing nucleoside triphosphate hydrolase protein [Mycena albidolilacea]|uniref:P-loop containing nucleoside triphosphate hydrolase protein n=1 Tax=Mycena albidolilacea TaxID=1033008 RepID=A0AAD7A7K8_9AGAR|nr:P-loop containing nucleoside triphosphate hydrolase protein [Mycena albidolilacea]
MQTLLKNCYAGLKEAIDIFGMTIRPAMVNNIDEMKKATNIMHEELLELIHILSDTSTSSDGSSPKIFHGRKSEVDSIMKMLSQQPAARIAILGAGGMGKTSLAKAVLHDPATSAEFEHRFFVSAEAATTSIGLAALIGLHLGLNPGQDLTRPTLRYFSRKPHSLLILDNLETITMRGTERPAKVRWTRPFLLPLEPLSDDAAQQIFADITDDVYKKEDIDQILRFTDNMPLAVDLIAHLSDYEGLSNVLARWETAKTSLFSIGNGQTSNLDASIRLSLASPRITSNSKELLSLLSILPEGLSDAELVQSNLGIPNILGCNALLQATSLAYRDSNNRLRSLVPVREHVQQFLPPSPLLISAFRKYFYAHLELYQKFTGEQLQPVVKQIAFKSGKSTGKYIHLILPSLGNHRLEIHFTIEILKSYSYPPGCDPEELVAKAIILLEYVDDPILKSKLYKATGDYFYNYKLDPPQSMQFYQKALGLAKLSEDSNQYCHVLLGISQLKWSTGDYSTAQLHIPETQREISNRAYTNYTEAEKFLVSVVYLEEF